MIISYSFGSPIVTGLVRLSGTGLRKAQEEGV
jgi:hypothetical protein